MNTEQLTAHVFTDLLDPAVPLLDVCRRHGVPIEDLPAILESEPFQIASRALNRATELRAEALAPDRTERALATLDAIIAQTPTSASHTECIRRAATALLRAAKSTVGRAPSPSPSATQPEHQAEAPADSDTSSGTGFQPVSQQPDTPQSAPTENQAHPDPVIGPHTQTRAHDPDKSPPPMTDDDAENHQPQGAWDACHRRTASAGR